MASDALKGAGKKVGWSLATALFSVWGGSRRLRGSRRAVPLSEARSILAIRLDLLGDLVFTLPAIHALHTAAPQARITLLALPYTASVVEGIDWIDRVVAVDVNRWRRPAAWIGGGALPELRRTLESLRAERFDVAVSFYGKVGASAALLSGARQLVGYRSEGYPGTFDLGLAGVRYRSGIHETEYCLDLARAIGARGSVEPPFLSPSGDARDRAERMLAEAGLPRGARMVALHPGALNMGAKRWPADRWAVVADRIQKETGCRVVLLGSAAEAPLVEAVRSGMSTSPIVLSGKTSIAELMALIARSDLFLGGDSGPLHLAWAMAVPTVAVYGPTDPRFTGPLGRSSTILRGTAECMPCYHARNARFCLRGDHLCMQQVSADALYEAAGKALAEKDGGRG